MAASFTILIFSCKFYFCMFNRNQGVNRLCLCGWTEIFPVTTRDEMLEVLITFYATDAKYFPGQNECSVSAYEQCKLLANFTSASVQLNHNSCSARTWSALIYSLIVVGYSCSWRFNLSVYFPCKVCIWSGACMRVWSVNIYEKIQNLNFPQYYN